jgi:hypothetical protein
MQLLANNPVATISNAMDMSIPLAKNRVFAPVFADGSMPGES